MNLSEYPHFYQAYPSPRRGLFETHVEKYTMEGWSKETREETIIGEDQISYVYRIIEGETGLWIGKIHTVTPSLTPIGIHKSRLIRWLDVQLAMFD